CGCSCFFFFQAEDGIRDLTVTGVQTCALPIYFFYCRRRSNRLPIAHGFRQLLFVVNVGGSAIIARQFVVVIHLDGVERAELGARSEERRVGKEGRARWAAEQ